MADPVVTSHHGIAPPVERRRHGHITLDGTAGHRRRPGEFLIAAAEQAGTFIPRFCYHPRMKPVGMCRMCLVEVSGPRGATLAAGLLHARGRRHGGRHHLGQGQEGPGRGARVPAREPPPRLPRVRQGRRVPAAGPGPGLRAGGEPVPRGEAALGQAHPHLRARAARPRALHPVRPLRPVRRRRSPARRRSTSSVAATPSRSTSSRTTPSRRTSAATPCRSVPWARSPPRPTGSRPGPGTSTRWSRRARCAPFGCRAAVQSSSNRVTRLLGMDSDPVNQSWLCDKGRFGVRGRERRRPPGRAARCAATRTGRPSSWPCRGPRPWPRWPSAWPRIRTDARARGHRRASAAPGCPTRTPTPGPSWPRAVIGTDSVDAQLGDGLPAELVLGAAPGHHRRGVRGLVRGGAGRRPARGAARPVPAPAGRRGRRGRARGRADPRGPARSARSPPPSLPYRPGEAHRLWPRALATSGGRAARARSTPTAWAAAARRARARRCRRRRRGGRDRAGRRWPRTGPSWPRRRRPWPRRGRRRGSCRPCGAATSWGPSTWASPPGCCPDGCQPRRRPGLVRGGMGIGARRRGARRRRACCRPLADGPWRRWCWSGPTRSATSPTGPWPRRRSGRGRVRGGGGRVPVAVGGAGRRGAARRHRPRAHRDDDQHRRAGSPAWARSWWRPGSAGPTG